MAFVTIQDTQGNFKVHAINEKLNDVIVTLTLDVLLFNGTTLGSVQYDHLVIPANSRRTQSVSLLLPQIDVNTTYVRATLSDYQTHAQIFTQNFFYVRPIYRTLPKPQLNITCVDA